MDVNESSTVVGAAGVTVPQTVPPGGVLRAVLMDGLSRAPTAVKAGGTSINGEVDWSGVCAVAHRCRIAPIVYQCLRASALPVPRDVMDWFRVQHYDTVARNLASLHELGTVLSAFSAAGIPAIVFKGPALAHLGHEMARSWQDLDILVRRDAIERVESLLLRTGYSLLSGPPHSYHRRYGWPDDARRSVLEVHFDINDLLRSHRPDVDAIWSRASEMTILGLSARVPELTDHLLLTIMQLPHHHWSIRLLLDIWQVTARWQAVIDWDEFFRRAEAWHMLALARTALSILRTTLGVPLPAAVQDRVRPAGYYDRLQREIAAQAITEQLEALFQPKVLWIAPFMLVDRPSRVPALLVQRLILGAGVWPSAEGRVERAVRRNMTTLAAFPAMLRLLLTSLRPSAGNGKGDRRDR